MLYTGTASKSPNLRTPQHQSGMKPKNEPAIDSRQSQPCSQIFADPGVESRRGQGQKGHPEPRQQTLSGRDDATHTTARECARLLCRFACCCASRPGSSNDSAAPPWRDHASSPARDNSMPLHNPQVTHQNSAACLCQSLPDGQFWWGTIGSRGATLFTSSSCLAPLALITRL